MKSFLELSRLGEVVAMWDYVGDLESSRGHNCCAIDHVTLERASETR